MSVRAIGPRDFDQIDAIKAPDALVIDMRDADALPVGLGELKRRRPTLGVVIVAGRQDPAVMLAAMRAGVSEWVTDLKQDDLQRAVERVATQHVPSAPAGKVFAFIGAKGGVGTTTIAVNVAAAIAKLMSSRTLVADLHLAHGDASLFLGAEPRFSIVDAIQNPHRLDAAFFRTLIAKTKAGPDLLASSDRPVTGVIDPRGVGAVIEFAARQYEFVVLDVPRSDAAMLDALSGVNRITVVANQELATVRSASRIAATLRQRYGRDRVGIVVSRYDKTSEIASEDVAKAVGGSVSHLFPSDYRLAVNALNVGRPLVLENHSRLAGSYVEFARELAGVKTRIEAAPKSGGLLDMFGRRRS
jgi:pilus assembly protein CpaE